MTQEMVGSTEQMEASLQRDRPSSSGGPIVQPRWTHSVTKVPCVTRLGKKKRGLRSCGCLPKASFTASRFASDGFTKVSGRVRAGTGIAWSSLPQTGMARSDPPVQWLKVRNFSCTGCGAIPVQNLSFIPEPTDRQPATLHGPEGRRIVLQCHLREKFEGLRMELAYVRTSCEATRDPGLDDPAPSNLPASQRVNDGASVALSSHSSQNSIARQEEEEWIFCEFDDLGNLIEEC